MLFLLWDLRWHGQADCLRAGGHRFGAVIGDMRTEGWEIETRRIEQAQTTEAFEYRLVHHSKGNPGSRRRRLYISHSALAGLARGEVCPEVIAAASEVLDRCAGGTKMRSNQSEQSRTDGGATPHEDE